MGEVAGRDRSKVTMVERQESEDAKPLRGRDDRGVGKANLEVAIPDDQLPTAHKIGPGQRDELVSQIKAIDPP
jgi:hypothetical protein